MDVDETAIGAWPNIAIDPRTGRHAATGEEIERGTKMTDNRATELLYAVNEDGIQAYCPFDSEASCGNWCPMLGYEGDRWFCTLSVNRTGCGQRLMLVPKSQLPGRPHDDWNDYE